MEPRWLRPYLSSTNQLGGGMRVHSLLRRTTRQMWMFSSVLVIWLKLLQSCTFKSLTMIKIEQLRYLQSTACGSLLPQINKISIKAATKSESVNHLPIEISMETSVLKFGQTCTCGALWEDKGFASQISLVWLASSLVTKRTSTLDSRGHSRVRKNPLVLFLLHCTKATPLMPIMQFAERPGHCCGLTVTAGHCLGIAALVEGFCGWNQWMAANGIRFSDFICLYSWTWLLPSTLRKNFFCTHGLFVD
jgi:hypothetical protein